MPHSSSLIDLLEEVEVHKSSLIRVTGPSGLPAVLWLCRHGYEQVGYLRADQRGPHEPADAVLVAHTCDEAGLTRVLAAGPLVRAGGVLIVQTQQIAANDGDPIRDRLEQAGYEIVRRLVGCRREVHVALRRASAFQKAA
ncbi:hypothetical protein [Phenylobacterium sp.]|uniref:hypothetical protein n=1 Tax=Phenylobacterium sp. TaxID=1871053 RepID=UPI00286BDF64|nr:hypothetical protein [Phenylobacterium sp.]